MAGTLIFPIAGVRKLLEHAKAAPEHTPTFGQMFEGAVRKDGKDISVGELANADEVDFKKVPFGLHLVGDEGVYLMSNGLPHLPGEDGRTLNHVVYAEGCNPLQDEDYYENKRQIFGGDDGVEFVDGLTVESLLRPDATAFVITIAEKYVRLSVSNAQRFVVLVPAQPDASEIVPGSGIVAPEDGWKSFISGKVESVVVHYEGNKYGAENLKTFHDRVFHAAGRAVERYPTIAKRAVFERDAFVSVGTFIYGPRDSAGRHGILVVEDKARVLSWTSEAM